MVKGTTTQFRFQLPCDFQELDIVKITFWQEHNNGPTPSRPLPIIKTKEQCSTFGSKKVLAVTLNQEETLRFSTDRKAYVQFRAVAWDGTASASRPTQIKIYSVYNDEIIGDIVKPTPDPGEDDFTILEGGNITEWDGEDDFTILEGGNITEWDGEDGFIILEGGNITAWGD